MDPATICSDYQLGGYFLSRFVGDVDCSGTRLREITLANDHTQRRFVPDDWAFDWVEMDWHERVREAAVFGMDEEALGALLNWVARDARVDLGVWSVFRTIESARSVQRRFVHCEGIELWGIGLHVSLASEFLALHAPAPPQPGFAPVGVGEVYNLIQRRLALAPGGAALGYELLSLEGGACFDSVESRHGDEVAMLERASARANEWGLITDLPDALRCRAIAPDLGTNGERGWFPWLVLRYPLEALAPPPGA